MGDQRTRWSLFGQKRTFLTPAAPSNIAANEQQTSPQLTRRTRLHTAGLLGARAFENET